MVDRDKSLYSSGQKGEYLSTRHETLRVMVLSVIADDYESFRIIAHETSEWAGEVGLAVNHRGILDVLAGLILEGLAKAYILSSHAPYATPVEYSPDRVQILWYWITDKGKLLLEESRRNQFSGRLLAIDPNALRASPTEPAFVAKPQGARAYHGFQILSDVVVEGFTLGKITDFEAESVETGDAFVVAPDNSRAGLVWEISGETYFEEVMGAVPHRWGVWAVSLSVSNDEPRQRAPQS
jgi:hypothetical protein